MSCIGIVLVARLLHVLQFHLLGMEVVRMVVGAAVASLVTVASFSSRILIRRAESTKAVGRIDSEMGSSLIAVTTS